MSAVYTDMAAGKVGFWREAEGKVCEKQKMKSCTFFSLIKKTTVVPATVIKQNLE